MQSKNGSALHCYYPKKDGVCKQGKRTGPKDTVFGTKSRGPYGKGPALHRKE